MTGDNKIHDMEVDLYLKDCVTIAPEAIQEEFVRVPADIAYWGELYANALRAWKIAKLTSEKMIAMLNIEHRERLIEGGVAKPTVDAVKSAVVQDDRYEVTKLAEIEAEAAHASLRSRCQAIAAKKDMVQSLGAQLRVEMGHDPTVRDAVRATRQISEMTEEERDF